tara:strand:- start:1016 stop:1993 length:978 start_codon:yes stop_codon:yes gene_type:complete
MMENCVRCNVNGDEVKLFDAIYDGVMERICERCSIIENIPVIKKPDIDQLKDAEQVTVYKRMKGLAGFPKEKEGKTFFVEDKLKELDTKPELEIPESSKLNLVEHFHWEIMKNRRRKGLSQKQLGENLGESETAIAMIEKAKLPENAEILVNKLEQFFQVKLRKISEVERRLREMQAREKPALLDEKGHELEFIPEPEVEIIEELEKPKETDSEIEEFGKQEIEELEEKPESKYLRGLDLEKGELDITKANLDNITIADLKELHRKKIDATKAEKDEEKRKIEERQKLIEAKKEELRILREKESSELDRQLGGSELLRKKNEDLI